MVKLGWSKDKREHRYVDARLSAYVDDEVSDREQRRIEAHLAACETCRAELRVLRWTVGLLRQAPPVKAPRLFAVREADLAQERQPARARAPLQLTQWATAVVALLFVLVVGVDLLAGRGLPRAATTPLARGERDSVSVTEVVEVEALPQEAVEQPAEEVAQVMPEAAPPMPTLEAQLEAEAAPVDREDTKRREVEATGETPMAIQAQPELLAPETVTVTATEEAAIMLAAPEASPTPAPEELPEVALQPEAQLEEPKLAERALPTPSRAVEEYGLRTLVWRNVLLWRIAQVVLGLALVGLLIAVVWMRSRR